MISQEIVKIQTKILFQSKSRMLVPKWAAEGLVIKMSEVAVVILERSRA